MELLDHLGPGQGFARTPQFQCRPDYHAYKFSKKNTSESKLVKGTIKSYIQKTEHDYTQRLKMFPERFLTEFILLLQQIT